MIKLTCGAQTALNILMVCNFYADNDCHNILSDDTARRMIKTVIARTKMSPDGICTIMLDEYDCVDLKLLLEFYEHTIAQGNAELLAILAQMEAAEPSVDDDADADGNMPCDTYGMCAGTSCKQYFSCH